MNVLIIGGTGFLGYHATHEFLRRGHTVTALARKPLNVPDLFPASVRTEWADLNRISDDDVLALVKGHEAVVYAAGVHVSAALPKPAYDYYHRENVKYTSRFFKLARQAGAKRGVLLGSYYTHFDRLWPQMHIAEHHPYIRSRKEQQQESLNAAWPDLELMMLELPYVFGAMPGRVPTWKPLVRYVHSRLPLVFMHGGTNMVAVKHVAEAIVGAVERGKGGERYQIGEENVTWADFLERLSRLIGNHKRIIILPTPLVRTALSAVQVTATLRGLEAGLQPTEYSKLQTTNLFFDSTASRQALNYGQGGLNQALQETIKACLSPTATISNH